MITTLLMVSIIWILGAAATFAYAIYHRDILPSEDGKIYWGTVAVICLVFWYWFAYCIHQESEL